MKEIEKLWAKSDGTTIREHTDKLLHNLKVLKELYGDLIERALPEELREDFWKALELACEYHDYGKMHSWFQKRVRNPNFKRVKINIPEVRHNLLSPAFLPKDLNEDLKTLISLAIVHHHDYDPFSDEKKNVERVLREEFNLELGRIHRRVLNSCEENLVKEKYKTFYTLLKGFLLRLDHASSSRGEEVETKRLRENEKKVRDYLRQKGNGLNDLQEFVLKNREENLLINASTGYGKTEAGFIYLSLIHI